MMQNVGTSEKITKPKRANCPSTCYLDSSMKKSRQSNFRQQIDMLGPHQVLSSTSCYLQHLGWLQKWKENNQLTSKSLFMTCICTNTNLMLSCKCVFIFLYNGMCNTFFKLIFVNFVFILFVADQNPSFENYKMLRPGAPSQRSNVPRPGCEKAKLRIPPLAANTSTNPRHLGPGRTCNI